MHPPFPGRIRDPRKFTQDTGITFPAEDLINSPQAAQPNTEVLFKTNPSTWPGSCQRPAPPPSPPTSSLLQQPSSLLPLLPAVAPSQVCLWLPLPARSRPSKASETFPAGVISPAHRVPASGFNPGGRQPLLPQIRRPWPLDFLSINVSLGLPLPSLATFSPFVAPLPCTPSGSVFLLPLLSPRPFLCPAPSTSTFVLSCFNRVRFVVTPWTAACQAPLSTRFSKQEYWSELPCPPPGILPDPGIELASPVSPALLADSLPTETPG